MEKGRIKMKLRSGKILQEGKREIRAIGDSCDPSCFTWFACGNSKPNGICKGFVLLDGETRKLINRNLTENDALYIENCMRIIQNGNSEEPKEQLVQEVLRYIPPPKQQPSGFIAMLESAHPTTEKQELEEPHTNSEFQRMLDASGKNSEPHTIVERQIQPWDFEYRLPETCNDGCFAKRFCSSYPRNVGETCVKRWEQYKNKESKF
jgi:hypothetical protein